MIRHIVILPYADGDGPALEDTAEAMQLLRAVPVEARVHLAKHFARVNGICTISRTVTAAEVDVVLHHLAGWTERVVAEDGAPAAPVTVDADAVRITAEYVESLIVIAVRSSMRRFEQEKS